MKTWQAFKKQFDLFAQFGNIVFNPGFKFNHQN